MRVIGFLFFMMLGIPSHAQISVWINGSESDVDSTFFITIQDEVKVSSIEASYWYWYKPLPQEYDNLAGEGYELTPIIYQIQRIATNKQGQFTLGKLPAGTHYLGIATEKLPEQVRTTDPIHLTNDYIIQLAVRESDDYLGMLTEQLGLPFILPPRWNRPFGHQADLRVGLDCAELAIYGMRRLGHRIPYGGPRGIVKYLEPTTELKSGTIIHYGFQVSVLYEDRGTIGVLDDQDLLIHAYEDQVKIEKLGGIALAKREYRLYQWKL